MKKKMFIMIIAISAFILCMSGCGATEIIIPEIEANQFVGDPDPDIEQRRENAQNYIQNLSGAFENLKEAMATEGAKEEGIKQCQAVIDKYEERAEEIMNIDVSGYSKEELNAITEEVTVILSEIRIAKDKLGVI